MPVVEIFFAAISGIVVANLALALSEINYSDFMSDGGYSRGDLSDKHKKKLD
jgi:hypothetical protein